ncbi:unnamed protein product [Pylaiella littoralis]
MDIDTPRPQEAEEGENGLGVSASMSFATTSGLKLPPAAEIRWTLLNAMRELSKHGLNLSTKWAAEQLIGLPDETPDEAQEAARFDTAQQQQQQQQMGTDSWLEGRVAFARCLMDVGEFERASQVFGDRRLTPASGEADVSGGLLSRARFLRWYSLYLAGERRRQEESQLTDALQRRRLANPHLKTLHKELSACDAEGSLDAFGLFIYATVLKARREEGRGGQGGGRVPGPKTPRDGGVGVGSGGGFVTPRAGAPPTGRNGSAARGAAAPTPTATTAAAAAGNAQEVLARSLRLFPYNWSAWLDLASLCLETDSVPEGLEADPPCQWMYQFFLQHLLVEQHRSKDALAILDDLHPSFPGSSYVLAQTAVAHYHLRNFDQGHADFKELRRRDPVRMESLDVFSNILYVKECKAELSFLAHSANKSAPLRPETNCIIAGNYYSLKGQHEKAVTYFLKALRLDRRCLSAWTLMGHEFVELKNSGAAIEAYRQAVDINPKDYRAWYGLGQAYEILQMHLYAIYYYRRATALRPYDARMWIAMGQCLENLERSAEAISTYERAMANDDREGIALAKLAKLYNAAGRKESAAKCYETMLANRSADGDNSSAQEGMQFLCHFYKDKGDYTRASKMANGLLDYGASKEEALAVLRELRSIMEIQQHQPASSASFMNYNQDSINSVTPGGGGGGGGGGGDDRGWSVFTPVTHRVDGSSPRDGGGSGINATTRGGAPSAFQVPASRRRSRGGGGVSQGAGGGDGGGRSGAGDYRLMDSSGGVSFMARSPESMSVAMSMGSESSDNDFSAEAAAAGGGGGGGGGGDDRSRHGGGAATAGGASGAGLDGSREAGGGGDPEESFSDFLSP